MMQSLFGDVLKKQSTSTEETTMSTDEPVDFWFLIHSLGGESNDSAPFQLGTARLVACLYNPWTRRTLLSFRLHYMKIVLQILGKKNTVYTTKGPFNKKQTV
jgi:hypothetical protein